MDVPALPASSASAPLLDTSALDDLSPTPHAKMAWSVGTTPVASKSFVDMSRHRRSIRLGGMDIKFGKPLPGRVASETDQKAVPKQQLLTMRSGKLCRRLRLRRIHHFSQLYVSDWFHTMVDLPANVLIIIFVVVYLSAFSVLAYLFWSVREECGFDLDSPVEAFALSAETWLTIGYGVPDPFFRSCTSAVVIVTAQGLLGLILNSLVVGVMFTQVSSGNKRGASIIFSERAVVREVQGRLYLMIQLCELRRTQLLEAHVRLYVVRSPACSSESPVDGPQAFELRLVRPNDERGAMLWPVLPSTIVHEIDVYSALAPPSSQNPKSGSAPRLMTTRRWADPIARAFDARNGDRDSCWCATCGDSFPTPTMLAAHQRYFAEQDALAGAKLRHRAPEPPAGEEEFCANESFVSSAVWRHSVRDFLSKQWFEIVCVVEGVDGTTAATVQTLKSYTAEDISWDHTFDCCFTIDSDTGAEIDFTKIHRLVPAPPE